MVLGLDLFSGLLLQPRAQLQLSTSTCVPHLVGIWVLLDVPPLVPPIKIRLRRLMVPGVLKFLQFCEMCPQPGASTVLHVNFTSMASGMCLKALFQLWLFAAAIFAMSSQFGSQVRCSWRRLRKGLQLVRLCSHSALPWRRSFVWGLRSRCFSTCFRSHGPATVLNVFVSHASWASGMRLTSLSWLLTALGTNSLFQLLAFKPCSNIGPSTQIWISGLNVFCVV